MAKILAMISLDKKTSNEISKELANSVKVLRKRHHLTQVELAKKSGMSIASYKRFEQKGLISLQSLINISIVLGCEDAFDNLFPQSIYASIEDVIRDAK